VGSRRYLSPAPMRGFFVVGTQSPKRTIGRSAHHQKRESPGSTLAGALWGCSPLFLCWGAFHSPEAPLAEITTSKRRRFRRSGRSLISVGGDCTILIGANRSKLGGTAPIGVKDGEAD